MTRDSKVISYEINEETVPHGCAPLLPQPQAMLSSFISYEKTCAEWAVGTERLRPHPPPAGFTEANWHLLKLDAIALLGQHGRQLAALGWSTLDVFGLHDTHPGVRISHSGLVRFIHGGTIAELTDRHARIRSRTGAVLTFCRFDPQPGAVPAWELHPEPQGATEMAEYTMDFDTGSTLGHGPWLRFHPQATLDGLQDAGTWSVRDSAGIAEVSLRDGLVFDWPNSKTGWMRNSISGQAPEKRWNASRAKFEPQPGKDFRRAILVPVAWVADGLPSRAIWEQANASSWMAYCEIMALIRDGAPRELPKLPLLGCSSHRPVQMRAGGTLIPQFTLLRYVVRPACLPEAEDEIPALPRGNGAMTALAGGGLDEEIPF